MAAVPVMPVAPGGQAVWGRPRRCKDKQNPDSLQQKNAPPRKTARTPRHTTHKSGPGMRRFG